MDEITTICPLYNFPQEATIVGRIIVGYAELETKFLRPVALATNTDLDTAIRLMYRPHSESARLDAYDAVVRQAAVTHGLNAVYQLGYEKMLACKRFRNQYAHCQWDNDTSVLSFINFDDAAKSESGPTMMEKRHVPLELLQKQEAFFGNTHHHLAFFNRELWSRIDSTVPNLVTPPPIMHAPRLYSQEHPHSPRNLAKAQRRQQSGRAPETAT